LGLSNIFKTKFTLLDEDWNEIFTYQSRVKPNVGEYIYVNDKKAYYKVIKVIHSFKVPIQTILVVEIIVNFK